MLEVVTAVVNRRGESFSKIHCTTCRILPVCRLFSCFLVILFILALSSFWCFACVRCLHLRSVCVINVVRSKVVRIGAGSVVG